MSDRFVLVGHPVGHSLSPVIHQAAYRALERGGHYELCDAPNLAAVQRQIGRLKNGEVRGINVTVPWKKVALANSERADASAAAIGAANVLTRESDGAVVAHNTDARALADELGDIRSRAALPDSRQAALVVGNGGAALAAVFACRSIGAPEVFVTARRFAPEMPESQWPGGDLLRGLGARLVAWPGHDDGAALDGLRAEIGLVVQATSAGMQGIGGGEVLTESLGLHRFIAPSAAYDLVYTPRVTPFVQTARAAGHVAESGLGMLVGQAARAIEIWWGVLPDKAPLAAAAEQALALRSSGDT